MDSFLQSKQYLIVYPSCWQSFTAVEPFQPNIHKNKAVKAAKDCVWANLYDAAYLIKGFL